MVFVGMSRRKQPKPYKVDDNEIVPELRRSKRLMKCNKCGKVLASALSLARHKLTHSQAKSYQCPKCDASFKTSSNMHRHLRIHSRIQDEEKLAVVVSKPTVRASRQNIRTPNKFREFDVDLIGVRTSVSDQGSENRFYTKTSETGRVKKRSRSTPSRENDMNNDNKPVKPVIKETNVNPEKSDEQDFFCHICNKSFISRFGLLTHSLLHPESASKCNICNQIFTTPEALSMHNIIAHKTVRNSSEPPIQPVNKKGFRDLVVIDFSVEKFSAIAEKVCSKVAHGHPKKDRNHTFICKKCNRAFPLLRSLELHVAKIHRSIQPKVEKDAQTDFVNLLNLHAKSAQHEENVATSDVTLCNGISDENIETSELVVTSNTPEWMLTSPDLDPNEYKLVPTREITPFVSGSSQQIGTERNVFWCRICNYSSHEKSAIVRHLLTHSGIRPYFCKICKYAFTTKANCERHVRKRHNCTERAELNKAVGCDWEMLKKAPRDDIYMITGSNSSCPVCSKSFSSNNELKEHLRVHEERQFVCQLCNIRCTTRNNCVRHILHKHPGIPHTEANNIIIFAGSKSVQKENLKSSTSVTELSQVNISKGSLLHKDKSNSFNQFRWKSKHEISMPRSRNNAEIHAVNGHPTKTGTEMSNGTHESENMEGEGEEPPQKVLKLIPLLKIKAYNEAAMRSYEELVEMYRGLNEETFMMHKKTALDKITQGSGSEPEEDENPKTAFVCWGCSCSFDTENELNLHLPGCSKKYEEQEQDVFAAQEDGTEDTEMETNEVDDSLAGEYSNMNYNFADNGIEWPLNPVDHDLTDERGSIEGTDGQNGTNSDEIVNMSQSGDDGISSEFQNVGEWVQKIVPRSPESNHSSETPITSDSPFLSDIPRVFAKSNRETAFEDNLIMSLFNEKKNKRDVSPAKSLQNYSSVNHFSPSSLPTMVNIDSMSLTRRNFNDESYNSEMDNSNGEEKVLVPSKGRFYTARKCPQCDKSFPWASSLRRHIMTHTGLKLYMCRLCKMRFTTRSNLIRHVYRRHGMAKQHPDFASCLAKLHPSDTLLREVEADVRRRVETQKKPARKRPQVRQLPKDDQDAEEVVQASSKFKVMENDFQLMLEEDPETLLVDLDYSPRDDIVPLSRKRENIKTEPDQFQEQEDEPESLVIAEDIIPSSQEEEEDAQPLDMSNHVNNKNAQDSGQDPATEESDSHQYVGKSLRLRARRSAEEQKKSESSPVEKKPPSQKSESAKSKLKNKQSTQFVCGLCKKIFKTVPDLVEHLDTHDVPHSWHCSVCGVPFTNKYNCQRHLIRRHGRGDLEPVYVEDSKHGPRTARGLPRKNPLLEDSNLSINSI